MLYDEPFSKYRRVLSGIINIVGGFSIAWMLNSVIGTLFPALPHFLYSGMWGSVIFFLCMIIWPILVIKILYHVSRRIPELKMGIYTAIGSSIAAVFVETVGKVCEWSGIAGFMVVMSGYILGWFIPHLFIDWREWRSDRQTTQGKVETAISYGIACGYPALYGVLAASDSQTGNQTGSWSFICMFVLVTALHLVGIAPLQKLENIISDRYDGKARKAREEWERFRAEERAREAENERQERARREKERRERAQREHGHNNNVYTAGAGTSYFRGCTTPVELKRAYRKYCKLYHPDNPNGNAEIFKKMQAEYEMLLAAFASTIA